MVFGIFTCWRNCSLVCQYYNFVPDIYSLESDSWNLNSCIKHPVLLVYTTYASKIQAQHSDMDSCIMCITPCWLYWFVPVQYGPAWTDEPSQTHYYSQQALANGQAHGQHHSTSSVIRNYSAKGKDLGVCKKKSGTKHQEINNKSIKFKLSKRFIYLFT